MAIDASLLVPGAHVEVERWPDSWYVAKIVAVADDQATCTVTFPGVPAPDTDVAIAKIRMSGAAPNPAPTPAGRQRAEASISRLRQRDSAPPSASKRDTPSERPRPAARPATSAAYRAPAEMMGDGTRELAEQVRQLERTLAQAARDLEDERAARQSLERSVKADTDRLHKRQEADHAALASLSADVKSLREKSASELDGLAKTCDDIEGAFEELATMVGDVEAAAKEALEGETITALQTDSSDAKDAIEVRTPPTLLCARQNLTAWGLRLLAHSC